MEKPDTQHKNILPGLKARFDSWSRPKKIFAVAAASAAAALALDRAVLPLAFAPKLAHDLGDAIARDDGAKVDAVLHHRYASGLWSLDRDEDSDRRREFLGPRICDAVQGRRYNALDKLLASDPAPFRRTVKVDDSLFFFIQHDAWVTDEKQRGCAYGAALKSEDTRALDVFRARGVRETTDDFGAIAESGRLVSYFGPRAGQDDGRDSPYTTPEKKESLISYMILMKEDAGRISLLLDRAAKDGDKDCMADGLRGAISTAAHVADEGDRAYGVAVLKVLLQHGGALADVPLNYVHPHQGALEHSMMNGTPETTRLILQAGGDADAALRGLIGKDLDPAALQGWDASVRAAAKDDTRRLMDVADQRNRMLERQARPSAP